MEIIHICIHVCIYKYNAHKHLFFFFLPVLCIGEVASALIDLQGALTRTFTFILFHSEKQTELLVKRQVLAEYHTPTRELRLKNSFASYN